jgi:undecaprenyl-diphosphatase
MNWIEALILGLVQGFTEFLPVSSSGHLEIGQVLLKTNTGENLIFAIFVHGATVLSTIVVFFAEITKLFRQGIKFRYNDDTSYILKIVVSILPVFIIGILFQEKISSLFEGNLLVVGGGLILSSILLALTGFIKIERKNKISFLDALIIGIAQAIAVVPGLSRSGSTIATGILLGNKREEVTKFSFLMVLIPIIGANLLDLFKGDLSSGIGPGLPVLFIGFTAAFFAGLIACKWMISLVKKGNLIYFSIYCFLLGLTAIIIA